MTLIHHADDATLMAYAAGAVTEGFSLVIAAHLEQCPRCRNRVADAESLGGEGGAKHNSRKDDVLHVRDLTNRMRGEPVNHVHLVPDCRRG